MSNFKQNIRHLTGKQLSRVEWIYSVSPEDVGDGEELYSVYTTLQVKFMDSSYISVEGMNYCTDKGNAIKTMCGDIEHLNTDLDSLSGGDVDLDIVADVLFNYLLQRGDETWKEVGEHVYFEAW